MDLVDEQLLRWRHVALEIEDGEPLFRSERTDLVVEDHHVAAEPDEAGERGAVEEVAERGLAEDAVRLRPVQPEPVRQRAEDDALSAAPPQHDDRPEIPHEGFRVGHDVVRCENRPAAGSPRTTRTA